MKNQNLAASAKYKTPINYSSPAKNLGVFVDGERVTRAEGLKADKAGGNVTWTNKDADWKLDQDIKSDDPEVKSKAEESKKIVESNPEYKGEKGKEKEFNKAKLDDAKAQQLLEKRTKNLAKKGHRDAGVMDEEGRKGSNAKITSEKAFEEANKEIKTEVDDQGVQLVKGCLLYTSPSPRD